MGNRPLGDADHLLVRGSEKHKITVGPADLFTPEGVQFLLCPLEAGLGRHDEIFDLCRVQGPQVDAAPIDDVFHRLTFRCWDGTDTA